MSGVRQPREYFSSDDLTASAIISTDGLYRYSLNRWWDNETPKRVLWLMLNPSTADAATDDATIRRCTGFAKSLGAGGLTVVNLYAYRATDPKAMWAAQKAGVDIVGPDNDGWIAAHAQTITERGGVIVAGFGAHGEAQRVWKVTRMLLRNYQLRCYGTTKNGAPRHPLYRPAAAQLVPWVSA